MDRFLISTLLIELFIDVLFTEELFEDVPFMDELFIDELFTNTAGELVNLKLPRCITVLPDDSADCAPRTKKVNRNIKNNELFSLFENKVRSS